MPISAPTANEAGRVARLAAALTSWTERWIPDAFVFALVATLILGMFGLSARDVMDYTLLEFFALVPTVLILLSVLGLTLRYPL